MEGAQAVAGGAFEGHGLEAEGDRPDLGVAEGFGAVVVAAYVVAFPQPYEVGAFEEEFADELGEVGGVGVGAGEGAEPATQPRICWSQLG